MISSWESGMGNRESVKQESLKALSSTRPALSANAPDSGERASRSRLPSPVSRPLTGILLLDKPSGISSNRALQDVRKLYRAAKAGHTGSLDPLATGLLPICFGEATKIAGLMLGADKEYEVECRLGITTTTDDAEGETIKVREVPSFVDADIERVLTPLRGPIEQTPPVYSALKQDGVPLYRRARRGESVQPQPRRVQVHRFDLLEQADHDRLRLRVECGSGTYVRSLIRDLGEALGCGAHVTTLRRAWADPFREPHMHTFSELESMAKQGTEALDALLLSLETGLAAQPAVLVDEDDVLALRQGRAIGVSESHAPGPCVALDREGRAIALADTRDQQLRPVRVFNH